VEVWFSIESLVFIEGSKMSNILTYYEPVIGYPGNKGSFSFSTLSNNSTIFFGGTGSVMNINITGLFNDMWIYNTYRCTCKNGFAMKV